MQVELPAARRSVGAEVNWGVRFGCQEDAQKFLKVPGSLEGGRREGDIGRGGAGGVTSGGGGCGVW
jgi:hypothetical protein